MARNRGARERPPSTNRQSMKAGFKPRFQRSWFGKNWHIIAILATILFIAFFVRTYFGYSISVDNGYLVSGGSDSYYHERVIDHVMNTGQHLVQDPMLNYPGGMRNARPPLYDWSVAVTGSLLNAFGLDSFDAMGFALVMSTAFWGTLTIIPVFLMGRAAFGNKAGLVAALLFAIMSGHIQRSVMSNADHDAMVLFFAVCSFYFLMLALMNVKGNKWVSKWGDTSSIRSGIRSYLGQNKISLLYAVLSGTMLAAVAMIWTGFAYLVVIVLVYLLVQVLVNRFRDIDSMGVVFTVGLMLLMGFAIMAPVYYQMNYWDTWFDIPFYMFMAGMIFGGYFVITRDYPWTLTIPVFMIVGGGALFVLSFTMPSLFEALITGQGYFVQSKLYSTISEAQPPDFSNLVLSFGILTFWLSFAGVIYAAMKVAKDTSPYLIFIVVWSGVSMFMAISAGRFMFNAAPAFAITAGWIAAIMIDWINFQDIPKTLSGTTGNPIQALRKAVKLRHVLGALFLAFLIIVPNVWFAMDAGIPSNSKEEYSQQVYDVMPNFLKPPDYDVVNGTSWYFGAFSYNIPLPTSYWPSAWSWFSERDSDIVPEAAKPAFLSWWDYGFEAVREGKHPTVADNFQNAYQFAGQFITCQNEDYAIAMLITRTLEETGVSDNQTIVAILESYDVDVDKVNDIMTNPSKYVKVVLDHPDIYGPYDSDLSAKNAEYSAMQVELAVIGSDNLIDLYHDLREQTGIDIGYFAIDGRLFPFTAFGYNIFYAPASLSDHRTDQFNQPYDFYQILAVDQYGETHTFENVTADMVIVDYTIEYKEMFYESMLYRTFMGYGPYDIGYTSQGIPGISGSLVNLPPMQGWNLTHFRMVYRTAYYNPYPTALVPDHPEAWRAVSWEEAVELKEKIDAGEIDGMVDMSAPTLASGVVFVQYYEGAIIEGTATTESGKPFANAWVTVLDDYGVPHHTVKTDENGHYSAIMPFGNVTIVYSYGDLDLRTQVAGELLMVNHNISYSQAMRAEVDADNDGVWDYHINGDVQIPSSSIDGTVFWDIDGDGKFNPTVDEPMTDAQVILNGTSIDFYEEQEVDSSGKYLFYSIPPMTADLYAYNKDRELGLTVQEIFPLADRTVDIPVRPNAINGTLVYETGEPASGVVVEMVDLISGEVTNRTTSEDGEFQFAKLLPGNYSLRLRNQAVSIGQQVFNLENGRNVDKTFTIYDSMHISGTVRLEGTITTNVLVGAISPTTEVWTTSDSTGKYSLLVPEGTYTIYSIAVKAGIEYAWIGATSGTGEVTVNPNLVKGKVITGTVYEGGVPSADTEIVFEERTSGASLALITNSSGGFRTVLPTGTYFMYSHTDSHAIWQDVYISSTKRMDVYLTEAVHLSGVVWTDSNGNELMGDQEGMEGATITVNDPDGREITSTSDPDGQYLVTLVPGNTYQVSFSFDGYQTVEREYKPLMKSVDEDIELVPENRTIQGSAFFDTTALDDIEVRFYAVGGGAVNASVMTDAHGLFSISLAPGQYLVQVDQNVTLGSNATRWQNYTTLTVVIGENPEPLDLDVVKRARVYGEIVPDRDVMTSITFDGPETKEINVDGTFDIYLIPGVYDIYAYSEKFNARYASLERMTLDQTSSPIVIITDRAYPLDGSLVFGDGPFLKATPVSISDTSGATLSIKTNNIGMFTTYLLPGMYAIEVNYSAVERIGLEQRYLRYTGYKEVDMLSGTEIDIELDRDYDNSTVSGMLLGTDGNPVAGSLTFTARSETSMNASATATMAGFDLEMAPGEYSVYAKQFDGPGAYLGVIEIEPYEPNLITIQLESGLRFSGKTIYSGAQGPASIQISGDGTVHLESGPDGSYEIFLPGGSYSVTCSAEAVEREMDVEYLSSFELELESSTSKTIELEKQVRLGVTVQWNEQEKATILPGEKAVYTITLVNNGNVKDTYELSTLFTSWDVEFSQEKVTVDFGSQNSAVVTATILTPADAKVEHAKVRILAQSTTQSSKSGSVDVDVNIIAVRSLNLIFDKGFPTSGESYSYSVKLDNLGNIEDTYHITVANAEQLASLGWTYSFANTTERWIEVTVDAGKPAYFTMSLTPIRSNPDPDVELVLFARSNSEGTVQKALPVILNLPHVTVPDLSVTGTSVHDSAPTIPLGTIALGGAALVLFVIVVLLGYQKGVFRRRKR
ncbi:MAG TPA: carboxypeptidase regulatory-like domain-containing protein [Methanomassiliicoccales archaeon]|nr:carboxypeptidase regulatory-like domain-containing protein [Methanomassiliicoccales archaeon]